MLHVGQQLVFAAVALAAAAVGFFPPAIKSVPHAAFPSGAQRVAIYIPLVAGYATIDEGVQHIAAASPSLTEKLAAAPIGLIYPFHTVPSLAVWPAKTSFPRDPEQVLLLSPDAVLAWVHTADALKKCGLPVFEFSSLSQDKGARDAWRTMGLLTGRADRAAKLAAGSQDLDQVVLAGAIGSGASPKVVMLWQNRPLVFSLGRPSFAPAADIEKLGGINLASRKLVFQTDIEGLLALNPDVVLLSGIGVNLIPSDFFGDPKFSGLGAVRSRRVYSLPSTGSRMEGLTPDHAFYLQWLAEILFPREESASTLREMVKSIYQDVYRFTLSDANIDAALSARENSRSRGYDRLLKSGSADR